MKSVLVLQLEDRTNNNLNIFMNENKRISRYRIFYVVR